MTKFLRVPTKIVVRGLNFGPLWQRALLPNYGVWSAADTALFVAAIWHRKHIRVKLIDGLLTNEIKETDTLKGEDLVSEACQGLPTHVVDERAAHRSLCCYQLIT